MKNEDLKKITRCNFDFNHFQDLFLKKSRKEGINISDLEEQLGDFVHKSSSAIHNWRFQKNGPSDDETVRLISDFFELDDYHFLIKKNFGENEKLLKNDFQKLSLKKIYDAIIEFLEDFYNSNGFNEYWWSFQNELDPEICLQQKVLEKMNVIILSLKKEYIFLKDVNLYDELNNYIYNDLFDLFDGKLSYGYRFENLGLTEDYCKAVDKINDIVNRYV